MTRIVDLRVAIEGKGRGYEIDRIRMGGGGNSTEKCREMAVPWLREWIYYYLRIG